MDEAISSYFNIPSLLSFAELNYIKNNFSDLKRREEQEARKGGFYIERKYLMDFQILIHMKISIRHRVVLGFSRIYLSLRYLCRLKHHFPRELSSIPYFAIPFS